MRVSLLFAIGLFVVGCGPKIEMPAAPADAPLSAAAIDSVKAVGAAFAAGMNARDTTAVFALYADDAKVMAPDAPILDGAAGHPVMAGLIAAGASDFVGAPTTVYGTGDLAYTVGTATFKLGGASETVKFVEVLRRGSDGKWRYVVDMFSGVAPPAAAATK